MLTTESLNNEKVDIRLYSPQALAFLGDAVYEILVRERIVHRANMPVNKLHLQAVEQVRASYQSKAYAVVEPVLTEEELAALKRGRNISSIKPPKNGTMQDYRRATGLECLFGYLYLKGEIQRINELFLMIEEHLEQGE
ncbi:MAG: ribonuclease III [Negativibacillus massiliensis]|jgi:ribonuclease-3 family protein|uniref:Mini-ribonuclease 3 n=1 Tax=Negativibacillus massiliensis TaxID=1871035 RepID=UPI00033CFC9F|nr:ribonuclease III domain-containing protein [Negativibacillus massiliensis]MBS5137602.1 ribonuclease III [Clostridium sp.]MCI6347094.1 ribonuclease III [Negativibacillus massiliensis]CDA79516.1 mini-ribonuclease 3 [Clostridium sp. CAG:242]